MTAILIIPWLTILGSQASISLQSDRDIAALLNSRDPEIRSDTLKLLEREKARTIIPKITEMLHDPSEGVRVAALNVLATLGSDAKPSLPEIVQLFRNQDTGRLSLAAQTTLARLGPDALEALPALIEPITRAHAYGQTAREETPFVLERIGIENALVLKTLLAALADRDQIVKINAAFVLWRNGKSADEAERVLTQSLPHAELRSRLLALAHIASLGPKAHALRDNVRNLCFSEIPDVQLAAVSALAQIGRGHPESARILIGVLAKSRLPQVHERVAFLLGQFGPSAVDALPELQRLQTRSTSAGVRMETAFALWKIEPKNAKRSSSILQETLTDDYYLTREASANRLGQMGADAAGAWSSLAKACDDPVEDVRVAARRALTLLGGKSP